MLGPTKTSAQDRTGATSNGKPSRSSGQPKQSLQEAMEEVLSTTEFEHDFNFKRMLGNFLPDCS